MLSAYDDLPVHQVASTIDHAASGDPRWFDRYWFVVYDPDARFAIATGLGVYRNTNVVDGFASAVLDGVQHNVRLSRSLRPELVPAVGPLRYEVIEGLRRFRLVLQPGEHAVDFDLEFEGEFDAFEEDHHFARVAGMVEEDYVRFYQHGVARGRVRIAGEQFTSDRLWSFRDRSFGVRPGMGGPMPARGPDHAAPPAGKAPRPALSFGCAFGSDEFAGCCQFAESAGGDLLRIDGRAVRRGEATPLPFTAVEHDLAISPSGAVVGGMVRFRGPSGREAIELTFEPLVAPFAYPGFGYIDGYDDGRGLGAYRGEDVLEIDAYDVSADGVVDRRGRRSFERRPVLDQAMRARVNDRPGFMELVAVAPPPSAGNAVEEGEG